MMSRRPAHAKAVLVVLASSTIALGCIAKLSAGDAKRDVPAPWTHEGDRYYLRGPQARTADSGPRLNTRAKRASRWFALAYHFDANVFDTPSKSARRMGIVRRGTHLRAAQAKGSGCGTSWYQLDAGGYVCDGQGFAVSSERRPFWIRQPEADLNRPLFYRYARVTEPGAPRFMRMPSEADERALGAGASTLPAGLLHERMQGDYFLALDRLERAGARRLYRTVRGRYVRERAVEPREGPRMHGEVLKGDKRLPWAFVDGEGNAPLLRRRGERFVTVGRAEPHGSFALRRVETRGKHRYAVGSAGFAVPRERARVARAIGRPRGVDKDERWIHVDLSEQTLVAYEGDRPVFVTLISSGKEDRVHSTPVGLYHIREKLVSVTMSGDDAQDGHYEVAEVPWTQYYHRGYALHGAYWHDTFGRPRSHGCTNLAPADARWLFFWTTPKLPPGFHAVKQAPGTAVYFSREASDGGSSV